MKVNNKQVIGTFEEVLFPKLHTAPVIAKIDTGAYTGALHCEEIHEVETGSGRILKFTPFHADNKAQQTSDYYEIKVRSSNGQLEKRFIINTTIHLAGNDYPILLTLTDRTEMKYQVLIGRRFLKTNNLVVDASLHKK